MPASAAVANAPPSQGIAWQILDLLANIPDSRERPHPHPRRRCEKIHRAAGRKAFLASSSLALPPGVLGWLTVLPELAAIWRIQAQMVADIAGACGRHATLTREEMLYCLFRHAAAQAVRDVAVQVGARLLIQDVPLRVIEKLAAKIGVSVSKRLVGRGIARWLPVIGALGVGAYAYYDTGQVARTAIDLFGADAASKARESTRRS